VHDCAERLLRVSSGTGNGESRFGGEISKALRITGRLRDRRPLESYMGKCPGFCAMQDDAYKSGAERRVNRCLASSARRPEHGDQNRLYAVRAAVA